FPVSANMPRESDVLTEGINAQGLVDSLTQAGDGAGFVLLDTWQSAVFAANGMARLGKQIKAGRFAVIGAANDAGGTGPTPAARALRDQMTGDRVTLDQFVKGMGDQLAKAPSVHVYIVGATGQPALLNGAR